MSGAPFQIFPWQHPFLPDLKAWLDELTAGCPGSALLIVPHNRPWRYLLHLYQEEHRTGLLPKVLTLTEMVSIWRSSLNQTTLHTASPLDRVALLHHCVHQLSHEDLLLSAQFAHMSMDHFLPWGMRLAALLEEMLSQGLQALDMAYVEYEVSEPAASLLGALGRISRAFLAELEQRQWTTPGLDLFLTAEAARHWASEGHGQLPALLRPAPHRPVVVAGFATLSHTEDALLKALWQAGAHICLHSDPAIMQESGWHWACEEHQHWLRRWSAPARLAVSLDAAALAHKPRLHFFSGYDEHSQLKAMRALLQEDCEAQAPSTAVVLTNSSALMPVLHHLPQKDDSLPGGGINVSMGYPLSRSPLNQLLEALFQLHEKRSTEGLYYWRDLLQCLRHPYLSMLHSRQPQDLALRPALRQLEALLLSRNRFLSLPGLLAAYEETADPALSLFLRDSLQTVIESLTSVATTGQLADYLSSLCLFLEEKGGEMWEHFPLDREALYRLMYHVIPLLRTTCLAEERFDQRTLFDICRQVLEQERVPFEAEPLTGLQVLGMLETRLLHFDRVLIMDATDDRLPGRTAQDPLLPDSLRQVLGLPDGRRRERVTAHTLYRLCASADDVHFFWQEGISRSQLFDGKKSRSRFVEQLIWEEEQQRGALLTGSEGPLSVATCQLHSPQRQPITLARSAALDTAMRHFLSSSISATRLDTYLRCPLQFIWQYLCRLSPVEEINEGDDHLGVGRCVHETLRKLFAPYLHRTVTAGQISLSEALHVFTEELSATPLEESLPADSYLMLQAAARRRFRTFLEQQPPETFIMALEEELNVHIPLSSGTYTFTGRLDRLDRRTETTAEGERGHLYVLDYKTGTARKPALNWAESPLFLQDADLSLAALSPQALEQAFAAVQEKLPSLQLPCYITMLHAALQEEQPCHALIDRRATDSIGDAALVDLKDEGKECLLFGGYGNSRTRTVLPLEPEDLAVAIQNCHTALDIVLQHMARSESFTAQPGRHCDFCPFSSLCKGSCLSQNQEA